MAGNAIVLGAAGFIGRHVARTLAARGYAVSGLGRGRWNADDRLVWGISCWREDDVSEAALARLAADARPDVLIQCAGSGSVAGSLVDPAHDYICNVETTRAALEFIRRHAPGCQFVLPSSAAVYGTVDALPINVDTPLRPVSPYGIHKQISEILTRSYARHFGVNAAIVRLFSIYGIGLRKQLLWDACGKILGGRAVFSGNGNEERDWLHVEDAAALLVTAVDHAATSCPTVNGGTGVSTPIREIVELLSAALGIPGSVHFDGTGRPGDPDSYRADIAMLADWGWQPHHRLRDEVPRYADWYAVMAR